MNIEQKYTAAIGDWERIKSQDWIPFETRNRMPDPSKSTPADGDIFVLRDARGYDLATYRIRSGSVERLLPTVALSTGKKTFQMTASIGR